MVGRSREPNPADNKPLWQRLAWMAGIWACSLVALGVGAWVPRQALTAAGLKSH